MIAFIAMTYGFLFALGGVVSLWQPLRMGPGTMPYTFAFRLLAAPVVAILGWKLCRWGYRSQSASDLYGFSAITAVVSLLFAWKAWDRWIPLGEGLAYLAGFVVVAGTLFLLARRKAKEKNA